jgi:uncharacterized membrane protein
MPALAGKPATRQACKIMEMPDPKPGFAVILSPHRSLTRAGFITIMLVIAGVSFVTGVAFVSMGAWPVAGVFGLDVALVWYAFRRNFADAERHEILERSGSELVLRRFVKGVETEAQRFVKSWTRVEIEHDAERELTGPLYLTTRGRRHELASFLGAAERLTLADAIKAELALRAV